MQYLVFRYRVNGLFDFLDSAEFALIPPGASECTHTSSGAFAAHNVLALQLDFGSLQFITGDTILLQFAQFIHDNFEALTTLFGCCTCVNAHRSKMLVTCKPGRYTIDKSAFLSYFDEEARGH